MFVEDTDEKLGVEDEWCFFKDALIKAAK